MPVPFINRIAVSIEYNSSFKSMTINLSHTYSFFGDTGSRKHGGFFGGISGDSTITSYLSFENVYYTYGVSPILEDAVDLQGLQTASFIESGTDTYTLQAGAKSLLQALGEGWKEYRCRIDFGAGEKNYMIPISTDNIPSFCQEP